MHCGTRVNVFVDASFDPDYTNLAVVGCSTGLRDVPTPSGKYKRGVYTRCLGHVNSNTEAEYRAIFMAIELYADKYDYVYIYTDCIEAAGDPQLEANTNIRIVYLPAKWKRDTSTPENRIFGAVDGEVRGKMRKLRDELLDRSRIRQPRVQVHRVLIASKDHFLLLDSREIDEPQPVTQEDMSDDETNELDDAIPVDDVVTDKPASSCILL